jgi:hypothetical protein
MYDGNTQFGFVGSQIGALPSTLDQINPAYYSQIADFISKKGGRLASVTGVTLYDTLRIDAPNPAVMPTRDFIFFQNAVGAQQGLFITPGTTYVKQEIDVHPWISNGGQLAQGYEALIWSIGVQFHIVGSLDESVQTAGNAVNLTNAVGMLTDEAATDPTKMGNLLRAFQEGTYFQLFLNQTGFENGPGWRFPSGPYGASGFSAMTSAITAPAFAVADGVINNGFGWSYQMPVMRHIPSLTKFGVRMSVQNPFTITSGLPVRVVVTLEGIGIQPVTG